MTFAGFYSQQFSLMQDLEFCLRLVIAFAIGAVIGLERVKRFKDAGVRTHILVCCASALIMIISKYGFSDLMLTGNMETYGTRGVDASRVAAQAVSGISFLCAGVIFKLGGTVRGLTTAAGIWLTSTIGLAIGAGMYLMTLCMMCILGFLHFVGKRIPVFSERKKSCHLEVLVKKGSDFGEYLYARLKEWDAFISENKIQKNEDGTVLYTMSVFMTDRYGARDLQALVDSRNDVISSGIEAFHSHGG